MVQIDEVVAETERRFRARSADRERAKALVAAGRWSEADSPGRVAARLERLARAGSGASGEVLGLERLIGRSNLSEFNFLARGASRGASVARIVMQSQADVIEGYGSGVMVSDRLLLTNNHVLGDAEWAATSVAEFGYQLDDTGRLAPAEVFALDPQLFFFTDVALDFTVVGVSPVSGNGVALERFGWSPIIAAEGKAVKGEWLNIVQHPDGKPKAIALRENQLVDVLEDFLHYETDTAPGSSGSPVYNDQWELVALHHSGVPRRDERGRLLTIDGRLWSQAMGEEQLAWLANEGVRISRIARRLAAVSSFTPAQVILRDALLAGRAPLTRPSTPTSQPVGETAGAAVQPGGVGFTVSVPLHLTVGVGPNAPTSLTAAVATGPVPPPAADRDVAEALAELQRASGRPYYDEVRDRRDRDGYYGALAGAGSYAALSDLVRRTHGTTPSYKPSRELYPWVDLQPDLQLRSLYSGQVFAPEAFILEDARTEERRAAEAAVREATMGAEALEAFLEATMPFNCEHVVPQSWFRKKEPMRGDLHHLFACESACNSFRGNIPYFDFPDFEETVRDGCGRRDPGRFEPVAGKGPAARATLYFLLRYPGEIDDSDGEYRAERLPALLRWHAEDPPGPWEQHRNQAVFDRQGNRNPLIDNPHWADQIDFAAGLG